MKKNLLSLLLLIGLSGVVKAQLIFSDKFDYSTGSVNSVSSGVWATSSGTAGQIQVSAGSLTYTNYFIAGADGNKINLSLSDTEDIKTNFTAVSSGTVYYSFLLNVSASANSADYFAHFLSGSTQKARLFAKNDGAQFVLGIDGDGTSPTFATPKLDFNTTYLVVVSYTFNPGANDDKVNLWINPSLVGAQPSPDVADIAVSSDYSSINGFGFRQAGSNKGITGSIDGVKMASSWSETPLPITWGGFNAKVSGSTVELTWQTTSSQNSSHFEVLRAGSDKAFTKIAEVVSQGESASVLRYFYTDRVMLSGTSYYQIKHIDNDGKEQYSTPIAVTSTVNSNLLTITKRLNGTYEAQVYAVKDGIAKATIYDLSGQTVWSSELKLEQGQNTWSLPVLSAKSMYILVLNMDNTRLSQKIIN